MLKVSFANFFDRHALETGPERDPTRLQIAQ
jgi:hypothetical protein